MCFISEFCSDENIVVTFSLFVVIHQKHSTQNVKGKRPSQTINDFMLFNTNGLDE